MDYQQNFLASLAGGLQFGQDLKRQRNQTQLKGLAALAYGASPQDRPSRLAEMAKIDPGFAMQQQKAWNADDDRDREELVRMARFIKAAPPEQQAAAYTNILPKLRERGMQAPDWSPETQGTILQTVAALTQYDDNAAETPSGYREFELLTNAADYTPGSEEYKKAAGVRLGTVGRPSNAGYSRDTIDLGDGKMRPSRFNPRTGTQEYYDEMRGEWLQLGGPGAMGDGAPIGIPGDPNAPGYRAGAGDSAYRVSIEGITPQEQQRYANVMSTMRSSGFDDATITDWLDTQLQRRQQAQEAGSVTASTPTRAPASYQPDYSNPGTQGNNRAPVGVGAGRSKEDEAAAVERAKIEAQLGVSDRVADAEANAAAKKATAEARAKLEADIAATNSTRTRDAETTIDLLDRAERLIPNSTGSGLGAKRDDWAAQFGQSTPGGEAIAALRVLSGQLVSKMPRMEGPQSDADRLMYQQMAGDLANPNIPTPQRLAALREIRRLQEKYTRAQPPSRPSQPDANAEQRRRALLDRY